MDYYCQLNEGELEPQGRPVDTLPVILFTEYRNYKKHEKEKEKDKRKKRGLVVYQSKEKMLEELRELARAENKQKWQEIVATIYELDKS